MKSRIANSLPKNKYKINSFEESEAKIAEVEKIVRKMVDEKYLEISENVIKHFLAITLTVLDKEFGFGNVRLKRFLNSLDDIANFIMLDDVLNKKVDINDFSEYISKKHNINLDSKLFAKFIK